MTQMMAEGNKEDQRYWGPVIYHETRCRCPRCDAPNPRVKHTEAKTRYHLCDHCGLRFKSFGK